MLSGGASMTIASIWTNIASWSTPSILFCVLNLMIGIIFIASNFSKNNHHGNSPRNLTRSPSLLERVKSMNMSSFYTTQESHDHRVHDEYSSGSQLSRRSSLLQRVKSIDFSFSNFYNSVPVEVEQVSSTRELTRAPSFLDRVKSFKLVPSFQPEHQREDTLASQDEHPNVVSDQDLVEDTYLTSAELHNSELTNAVAVPEKAKVTLVKRSTNNFTKSRSEKRMVESDNDEEDVDRRRPATMREPVRANDECVDTKADDFIKRFKQQLKLQRLDSLQRFREMLNRGTSSA